MGRLASTPRKIAGKVKGEALHGLFCLPSGLEQGRVETQGGHRTKHTFSPGVGGASSLVSNRISPCMSTFSAPHLDSRVSAGVQCADGNEVALAAKLRFFYGEHVHKGQEAWTI